jgi:hypothetical protein
LFAFELLNFFVVENLSRVGVVVVHHELDAVDQGVDLVELVQPHRHFLVYVLLKFVCATWKMNQIIFFKINFKNNAESLLTMKTLFISKDDNSDIT